MFDGIVWIVAPHCMRENAALFFLWWLENELCLQNIEEHVVPDQFLEMGHTVLFFTSSHRCNEVKRGPKTGKIGVRYKQRDKTTRRDSMRYK